jgi:hypothetical protein
MSGRVVAFMRAFAHAFVAEARRVFVYRHGIEIAEQIPTRLVWRSRGRETVADQRLSAVMRNGRVMARFASIQSIDIQRDGHGDRAERWNVSLHMGGRSHLHLASSSDATDASILAAHLSTLTGKKVQALR